MEQTFDTQDAIALLEPCGVIDKYFTVDEHGVWPAAKFDKTDEVASNFEQWRPALVFADDAPLPDLPHRKSVARTPALPPKFNARELAAFMLDGWGVMVSDHYGEWDDGPRPDSLKDIPACEDLARLAVRCAFEAHREAQKIVGAPPWLLIAEANRARKARNAASKAANMREGVSDSIPGTDDSKGRRARAVASIAELDSEMEATAKQAQAAQEVWLNAMVRQLLQPASKQTKAPVTLETREPASAGTTPLAMNQIANCFASFHSWDVPQWKKSLGSPADWLVACRSARGTRGKGGSESTWWPLEIAAALIKKDGMNERSLRARFRNSEPLKPWFEQFEINYPKQD